VTDSAVNASFTQARGDRQDLIRLLSCVEDPRGLARDEQMKSSEKVAADIEATLDFGDPIFATLFPIAVLEQARQAFRLLAA